MQTKFFVVQLDKRFLFIGFLLITTTNITFGQKPAYNSHCEALKAFLTSHEVNSWFKRSDVKDSDLIIVDVQNNLDKCPLTRWRGFRLSIVNSGPLRDSLAKFNPYYVLRGRPKYYVLLSDKQNGIIIFFIRQGSSSHACEAQVFKRKNKFILTKIREVLL
jgi:hypothetical protein